MAVIQDYMDGPCRITVHDDSILPPEEVEKVIQRVSQIVMAEEFRRQHEMKERQRDETV